MHVPAQLLLLTWLAAVVLADHYSTLGVSSTASPAEIKKSYRKLALKHHPDKFTSASEKQEAEKRFAKIGEAYETLKDTEKRAEYDMSLKAPKGGGFGSFGPGFGGFRTGGSGGFSGRPSRGPSVFEFEESSFGEDLGGGGFGFFEHLKGFGGFGGPKQPKQPKQPRGPPPELYPKHMRASSATMKSITRAVRGDGVWLLHFFTKSSHGCAHLASSLKAMQAKLQGLVQIAGVDCDKQPALCEAQKVTQFPLVKLLSPGPVQQFSTAEQLSSSQLTTAALDALPSHVVDLRRPQHEAQFFELCKQKGPQGCVLLFTDKYETTPLYKRLSSVFQGKMLLGIVRGAHNSKLAENAGVSTYPTLQYYRRAGALAVRYSGKPKYESIRAFLRQRAA